jgi:Tol biopolymer transport system component
MQTARQRQITYGSGGHFMRWSLDGHSLFFVCPYGGKPRVFRAGLDESEPQPLPDIAGGSHLSLSPDHSLILDVVAHKTLWVSPVEGGEPRKIFEFENPSMRIDYPVWSPDGEWVVFDAFKPQGGDIWLMEDFE